MSGGVILQSQSTQDNGTITGIVTSEKGPEGGVWVIAETRDLPTSLRKIVVTDDSGRFLLPQLPKASYQVWARGYGLVDSAKVQAGVGQDIKLMAPVAKTPQEAAKIYPGPYWFSLMRIPDAKEFPGTGPEGNGLPTDHQTVEQWNHELNECVHCHTLGGTEWTRSMPPGTEKEFTSMVDMWDKRVRMGQRASGMNNVMTGLGRQRALQMFADWTDRIAKGEVPPQPPRPQGMERNMVITSWEWGTTMTKIHDITATDKRNPRVAPNSPVYGTDIARDYLSVLDPVANRTRELYIPTLEDRKTWSPNYQQSGYTSRLGTLDRFNPTNIHNPMKDAQGRVWYTATLRPPNLQPAWCKEGSTNKFAAWYPLARSGRNVSFYDPATDKFTMIDTCFGTHHLQFGFDANDTLWFSGGGPVYSWIRTREFLKTGDGQATQGWCPTVVDTNGDGRITKPWNEPVGAGGGEEGGGGNYPNFNPKQDTRVVVGAYGIIVNPVDGSVWGASTSHPGRILRLDVGNNPPETCMAEVYSVPNEKWGATGPTDERGSKPRGIDIDRNGVIWTALSASGHLASFDRRKCPQAKTGPTAHTGEHCLEGWTLYPLPGSPPHVGSRVRGTDFYYFNYVDQFNSLGLGENVPMAMGSASDSLYALVNGKPLWFRVPYPMGAYFPRGVDGRIDDPNAGWKGRGVYSGSAQDTVWHSEDGMRMEDGKFVGTQRPMIVKFQIRPNPLAN
jgi:hypothetical protein